MLKRSCSLFGSSLFIFSLFLLIFSIACSKTKAPEASANAQRYEMKGKVVSADKSAHTVTIAHEEIPGYMEAMTMPFSLNDDWVYGELTPGALVQATIVVDQGKTWLENPIVTRIADPNLIGKSEETGVEPDAGTELPAFQLINQDGRKISLDQYRGKTLIVTFIYTRCPLPDYCPLMSENFAQIGRELEKNTALKDKTHFISITLDPAYDKPKVLREYGSKYVGSKSPDGFKRWEFATGSEDQIKEAAKFFGLNYWSENNQIIHGLRTAIISPEGKVVKVYRGNEWKPEEVLDAVTKLKRS